LESSLTVSCRRRCLQGGRRVSQWLLPATAAPTARPIHVRRWSRRSLLVTRTTATHCFTESPRVWRAGCCLSIMRLHLWCRALDRLTVRPHHASATVATVASGSTSGGFQDGHPGLPVWNSLSLTGRRLLVRLVSDEGRRQLRSATKDIFVRVLRSRHI